MARLITRYNSMLYAARGTVSVARKIRQFLKDRAANKTRTNVVSRIREQTRGAMAHNLKAYSKSTFAGQKRRDDLAKKLRERRSAGPRPVRKYNPSGSSIKPKFERKRPDKIVIERGMTGRRLTQRIRQFRRREDFIKPTLKSFKGNRTEAARFIKGQRKAGIKFKYNISPDRMKHFPLYKKAVALYDKKFGRK